MSPAFFIPGAATRGEAEDTYEQLRAAAAVAEGAEPSVRRIFGLGCRMAGSDCVIEVGQRFPADGHVVLAIFDLGGTEGYRVSTASTGADVRVGRHVYWVTEFGSD